MGNKVSTRRVVPMLRKLPQKMEKIEEIIDRTSDYHQSWARSVSMLLRTNTTILYNQDDGSDPKSLSNLWQDKNGFFS